MAGRAKTETFSPVDATWLRIDTPTNIMMITGVMMFDESLDVGRLKEVAAQRLLRHERFRQRVVGPALAVWRPRWRTDPHFDLDARIHRIALPRPGDMDALQALVGAPMSLPLDAHKPL